MKIIIFIIGACIGSFILLVAERYMHSESIIKPNSHCFYCHKELKWFDKIPLVSYLVLQGKSRCCQKRIPIFYFLIEIFTGVVYLYIFIFKINFLPYFIFMMFFLIVVLQDLLTMTFDTKILILLFLSTLFILIEDFSLSDIKENLIFGSCTLIFFFCISKLTKGMGNGDCYIFSFCSILLGYRTIWFLCITFIIAGIYAVFLLLSGKNKKTPIPMLPWIFIAFCIMEYVNI